MEFRNIVPITEVELEQIIPHRRPFRFIDEIIAVEFGKKASAYLSDLTKPEYEFLKSHFPSYHLVPGAIILEALAEVGAVAVLGMPENRDKIAVLAGADRFKWRHEIKPGQKVILETEITNLRSNYGRGKGQAILDGKVAAEGVISFGIVDKTTT